MKLLPDRNEIGNPLLDDLVAIMNREDVMVNGIALLETYRGRGMDRTIDAFQSILIRHGFNDVKINYLGHWA